MRWHDLPRSSATERGLEQQLGWAEGTLAVLQHAFACQLPRYGDWHAPVGTAFVTAARYYKRGVVPHDKVQPLPALRTRLSIVAQLSDLQAYLTNRYIVCDQQVAQLHALAAPAQVTLVATEAHKSLAMVAELLRQWREQGSPPQWTIIGGGITLDVAAFAAALCGAKIVLIPTTLLAMIDAAHGGKNGVNFPPWGKNQLGTYHWAEHVVICPAWLQTLPPTELQAGGWEGVKHALIAGDEELLLAWLQCLARPPRPWPRALLQKTAYIKTAIVQRDPYERGERQVLNFGHTLAHALEAVAQDNGSPLRHGYAVGIGIFYALLLSQALGKIQKIPQLAALSNCRALLSQSTLARALGDDLNTDTLWKKLQHYFAQDKKRRGNKLWILLHDVEALPRANPEPQAVSEIVLRKVWQQLTQLLP